MQRPLLHQNNQGRAAANGAGVVAMLMQKLHGFGQGSRLE